MFLLKLIELSFIFRKNWIYYVVHKILNIILLIIFSRKASKKSKRACQIIQQNLIKCIKVQIDQEQSELIEAQQDQLNESILSKSLQETA